MTEIEIERLRALAQAASRGPWNSGPDTGAGNVWVYRCSAPLFAPSRFVKSLLEKLPLFTARADSYFEWIPGETSDAKQDRFWKQKQADAEFVAASREAVPELIAEVNRLRTQRDHAWRTLGRIEDGLGSTNEIEMAFILADGHGVDDCEEWNAVQEAAAKGKQPCE